MSPGVLLLLLTAVRLIVASYTPLAPDEAYYWIWSRALAPGYLDHPPMVALWIRLGTAVIGETALGVRLLAPLAALAGSALLADAADRLFPGRRLGVPAAALLNATLMLGAGAVTMTPDTPLLFFAVATLWALARVGEEPRYWLVAGAAAGCALDSKYTGALLVLAVPLWLVWAGNLRPFRQPWLWAGAVLAALLFAPVIGWNAGHGWVSLLKQGGRTGDWRPDDALRFLGELFGAQVALATPLVFVLFAAGLWRIGRGAARRDSASTLLGALALPGLLVFVEHALGDRVQANWLAILYPPLAIAAAAVGARWWKAAAGFGLVLTAIVYLQAAAALFALPRAARSDADPACRVGRGGAGGGRDAARSGPRFRGVGGLRPGRAAGLVVAAGHAGGGGRGAVGAVSAAASRCGRRAAADQRSAAGGTGPGAVGGGCADRASGALP